AAPAAAVAARPPRGAGVGRRAGGRRPAPVRRHRRRPRRGGLRRHRRAGRRARGRRAAQRGRQGRRPAAAGRRPPRHRPRPVGERPGQLRDRPEGLGGRPGDGRGGERADVARRRGGPPRGRDPVRLRPRRAAQRLRRGGGGGAVSLKEQFGGWNPRLWAGWRPNGVGEQKPNHYRAMARAAWANRNHPLYAWRVLTRGACDGCALGVAGLHDWTIEGVHLCTTRLDLLELNTADPFDPAVLADVAALRGRTGAQLRALGRLGYPMRRRRGERGFRRVAWDEALGVLAGALGATDPDRVALYLTSRGITNEVYYVAAKAARALGIANIDSAARVCHAPSTLGLKDTVGVAATTCSYQDLIEAPLVVLWGANPANSQPVFMKYLYLARRRGCRVVVVNPYLEPGLERYWVPSNVESALFGTRMCDLHVPVRPGGDVALANAALAALIARGAVDERFVGDHTAGFGALRDHLASRTVAGWAELAGVDAEVVEAFADELARAGGAVHASSVGITQHRSSADTVRAIVSLALAQGGVGRDGTGLMPIRGHSGVQGGAEMGAYATSLPGGVPVDERHAAALAEAWGFPVPGRPGLTAPEMVEAAARGD